ncbi:MAG: type II secretion system GspH family protein [Lachnospiraceae bacterium]|nr:type II secretion system GspH family protein [Lachnospiraceae bacterium]
MKINLRFLKKKTGKNKGFALIELICAVALFAVVLTPIFMSMVSSMRVNNKARKVMIATEVAEDVMESVRDKTYLGVRNSLTDIKSVASLSGKDSLVLFDSSIYSTSANAVTVSSGSISATASADVQTMEDAQIAAYSTECRNKLITVGADAKKTFVCSNGPVLNTALAGECLSYFALTNIERYQYHFDALVIFTPSIQDKIHTSSAGDYMYYSYQVKVLIFDADVKDAGCTSRFSESPVAVMMAGIRNK